MGHAITVIQHREPQSAIGKQVDLERLLYGGAGSFDIKAFGF